MDELLSATIWAQHTLHGAHIAFRDTDPARPVFRADTNRNHRFFTWTPKGDMDHYYSKRNQVELVKKILKTDNMFWDKIIIDTRRSGTDYLSRVRCSACFFRVILPQTQDLFTMFSRMPLTTSSMLHHSSSPLTMGTGKLWNSISGLCL